MSTEPRSPPCPHEPLRMPFENGAGSGPVRGPCYLFDAEGYALTAPVVSRVCRHCSALYFERDGVPVRGA